MTRLTSDDLPEFDDPPVTEVVLAVQFEPLEELHSIHLGGIWSEFRDNFPGFQEHPPLERITEIFGAQITRRPGVRFEVMERPPFPRVWFISQDETHLIQFQRDRFAHNWRKVSADHPYPRYETAIRPAFAEELTRLARVLEQEKIGKVKPDLCEVSYINQIGLPNNKDPRSAVGEILAAWSDSYTVPFLPELEEGRVQVRFVIPDEDGEPIGRLHITAEPAANKEGNPILLLTLMARGRPEEPTIDSALSLIDRGRNWVVWGFTAFTSEKMHELWKRKR
jgi:uncharacterized protein (TIGR04255 family)